MTREGILAALCLGAAIAGFIGSAWGLEQYRERLYLQRQVERLEERLETRAGMTKLAAGDRVYHIDADEFYAIQRGK